MSKLNEKLLTSINDALEKDQNLLISFLAFLSSSTNGNYVFVLNNALKKGTSFLNEMIVQMANDSLKLRDDEQFRTIMNNIYNNYINNDNSIKEEFNPSLYNQTTDKVIQYNVISALSKMSPTVRQKAIEAIGAVSKASNLSMVGKCANNVLSITKNRYVSEGLLAVYLTYEALMSIYKWWKGEISGTRCSKQIVDSLMSAGGGVGGGMAGSAIGSFFGPIGLVCGAVIGGLVGSAAAGELSNWLTCEIFNVPKDIGLENAYNFLGTNKDAQNSEINKKFRELCLKYHPDKGGEASDFHKLQCSMGIIKASRDECN